MSSFNEDQDKIRIAAMYELMSYKVSVFVFCWSSYKYVNRNSDTGTLKYGYVPLLITQLSVYLHTVLSLFRSLTAEDDVEVL